VLSTESCIKCTVLTSSCDLFCLSYCMPSRKLCKLRSRAGTPDPVGLAGSGGWRNTRTRATAAPPIWGRIQSHWHKDDRLTVGEDTGNSPACSPPPAWKSPSAPAVIGEGALHVRTKAHRAACRAFLRGRRGTGAVPAAP